MPCPFGKFGTATGATSPSICVDCPAGTGTLATGAYSPQACVSSATFVCPLNKQPASPGAVYSLADCAPLVCNAPLVPSGDGLSCRGCGSGTYGSPGACAACPPSLLCPGLASAPLFNFSAAAAAPTGCPFLALLPAAARGGAPPLAPAFVAQAVGGSLLGLLLLAAAAPLYRRLSGYKLPAVIKSYAHMLDLFSPSRPITVGADKLLAQRDSSTLGFSLTLFAFGALGVLAAVLALNRAASNTLTQQSLSALQEALLAETAGWAFAVNSSVPGLPGTSSGLFLRFTASGEPGACFLTAGGLQFSGLTQGAWELLSRPTCAGTAPANVDQFTLACSGCMLSAASTLSFTLPYSCQSVKAEAGAVDADGSFTALALPPVVGSPGALLSSLTWNLAPLLSVLRNTMEPEKNRRGWQLLSQGYALGPLQQLAAPAPGALSLQPLPSGVRVTVTLPLQPFAATTTLKELTSVIQLISSIVGFQAPVFAIAGIIFGFLAASRKQAQARSERGIMSSAPPAAKGAAPPLPAPTNTTSATPAPAPFFLTRWRLFSRGGRSEKLIREGAPPPGSAPAPQVDNAVAVENPLFYATPAPAAAGEPPSNDNTWTRHSDGHGDVWFTNASGDAAWELPPGAALAPDPDAAAPAPVAARAEVWHADSDGTNTWSVSPRGDTAWKRPPGVLATGNAR